MEKNISRDSWEVLYHMKKKPHHIISYDLNPSGVKCLSHFKSAYMIHSEKSAGTRKRITN